MKKSRMSCSVYNGRKNEGENKGRRISVFRETMSRLFKNHMESKKTRMIVNLCCKRSPRSLL